jgi:hypothetical protein
VVTRLVVYHLAHASAEVKLICARLERAYHHPVASRPGERKVRNRRDVGAAKQMFNLATWLRRAYRKPVAQLGEKGARSTGRRL